MKQKHNVKKIKRKGRLRQLGTGALVSLVLAASTGCTRLNSFAPEYVPNSIIPAVEGITTNAREASVKDLEGIADRLYATGFANREFVTDAEGNQHPFIEKEGVIYTTAPSLEAVTAAHNVTGPGEMIALQGAKFAVSVNGETEIYTVGNTPTLDFGSRGEVRALGVAESDIRKNIKALYTDGEEVKVNRHLQEDENVPLGLVFFADPRRGRTGIVPAVRTALETAALTGLGSKDNYLAVNRMCKDSEGNTASYVAFVALDGTDLFNRGEDLQLKHKDILYSVGSDTDAEKLKNMLGYLRGVGNDAAIISGVPNRIDRNLGYEIEHLY